MKLHIFLFCLSFVAAFIILWFSIHNFGMAKTLAEPLLKCADVIYSYFLCGLGSTLFFVGCALALEGPASNLLKSFRRRSAVYLLVGLGVGVSLSLMCILYKQELIAGYWLSVVYNIDRQPISVVEKHAAGVQAASVTCRMAEAIFLQVINKGGLEYGLFGALTFFFLFNGENYRTAEAAKTKVAEKMKKEPENL